MAPRIHQIDCQEFQFNSIFKIVVIWIISILFISISNSLEFVIRRKFWEFQKIIKSVGFNRFQVDEWNLKILNFECDHRSKCSRLMMSRPSIRQASSLKLWLIIYDAPISHPFVVANVESSKVHVAKCMINSGVFSRRKLTYSIIIWLLVRD